MNATDTKLDWALQYCQQHGLKKTQARDAVVEYLVNTKEPVTWGMLCEVPRIKELCNPSTVYRLLTKFEQIGLVRRITVREHPPYFAMALPGEHNDFVVCNSCGQIQSLLNIPCPGAKLEKQVSDQTGFTQLHHEFAFYGTCKKCATAA